MDDGEDSLQMLERLLGRYGDQVGYLVVLNRGRGGDFELFEQSGLGPQLEELRAPVLHLRALPVPTMRQIDRLDKSYWGATHNRGEPSNAPFLAVSATRNPPGSMPRSIPGRDVSVKTQTQIPFAVLSTPTPTADFRAWRGAQNRRLSIVPGLALGIGHRVDQID
jgi:hypothetical protein